MRLKSLVYGALIAAAFVWGAHSLRACFNLPETVFTDITHPDQPLADFVGGKLGIVQPTYYRAFLYVAYRNLAGPGFSAEEQQALWPRNPTPPSAASSSAKNDAVRNWLDERNKIPGITVKRDMSWGWSGPYRLVSKQPYSLPAYLNCSEGAFRSAAETLRLRAEKFGASSDFVRQWIAAQDEVFDNCQQGEHIPDAAPAGAPPLVRADRDYQIAAARFYGGDFEGAQKDFAEIAKDPSSPWSGIAPYLVARCLIRRATVGHDDTKPDLTLLIQAENQLKGILASSASAGSADAAQKLLDYVEARLHPGERLLAVAQALMKKDSAETLPQNLRDYTLLLDKFMNGQFAEAAPGAANAQSSAQGLDEVRARNDLVDWVLTMQENTSAALQHAVERWHATHSRAWLLVALTKAPAGDPNVPALLVAAEKIPSGSPGYVWATFHILRLMVQSGGRQEARKTLHEFLAQNASGLPRSSLNLFLALESNLAPDLKTYLKASQRIPVAGGDSGFGFNYHPPPGPRFDVDAVTVINKMMPVKVLARMAEDASVSATLRRQIAAAAWTRAVLLGEDATGEHLARVLEGLLPEAKELLETYRTAPTPEARSFAAAYFLLKFPGVRPYVTGLGRSTSWNRLDAIHENWWDKNGPCGLVWQVYGPNIAKEAGPASEIPPRWRELGQALQWVYPDGKVTPPKFLTPQQLAEAASEWNKLQALPSAPTWLTRQTLSWARPHADDSRVPEALHRAVIAARLGCGEKETDSYSRQAFELLHRRYPDNPWTKRTKYWYRSQP